MFVCPFHNFPFVPFVPFSPFFEALAHASGLSRGHTASASVAAPWVLPGVAKNFTTRPAAFPVTEVTRVTEVTEIVAEDCKNHRDAHRDTQELARCHPWLHRYTSLYMVLHGYTWLYMALHGYV